MTGKSSPRSRTKAFKSSGIATKDSSSRGKVGFNLWIFTSAKTGADIVVRTDNLFLQCLLMEADPEYSKYTVDTKESTWVDGKKLEATYDCIAVRHGAHIDFIESGARETEQIEEVRRTIATAHGANYIRADRDVIEANRTLLVGVKFGLASIAACRGHSLAHTDTQLLALFAGRADWNVRQVLEQFPVHDHPLILASLFRAIFAGYVQTDLHKLVWSLNTTLSRTPKTRRSSLSVVELSCARKVLTEFDDVVMQAAPPPGGDHQPRDVRSQAQVGGLSEMPELSSKPGISRRTIPVEYRDPSVWPSISMVGLDDTEQKRFSRWRAAVSAYLQGLPAKIATEEQNLNRGEMYRLLNRALQPHADGRIFGWRAFVSHTRISQYIRTAPVAVKQDEFTESTLTGFSGAFSLLLREYPEIHRALTALAMKDRTANRIHEARINARDLHQEFLRLCSSAGIRSDQYPFTSDDQGCRTIRRFLISTRESDFETGARILGGISALTRSKVATGTESLIAASIPFENVLQDGHKIDFLGSVAFPHPSGPRNIPISRATIEVVAESKSKAVIGYKLIFKSAASAEDAASAVAHALSKWSPLEIENAPFPYPQNSGLPSGLIPELNGAAWSCLLIDNASIYTTDAMLRRVRERVGCAINLGPVGNFTRRYVIEGINSVLAKRGFQRMPSTTGAHPKDTKRDRAEVKSKSISHEEFAYLIDVAIATYNATPLPSLAHRSPLQYLKELFHGPDAIRVSRQLPKLLPAMPDLNISIQRKTIRGNQKEGRRPYIEFQGCKYTSPLIASSANLIGTEVDAHLNVNDLRAFEIFLIGGGSLGFVTAEPGWARIKHDLQQRIMITKLLRTKELIREGGEDYIQTLMRFLSQRAVDKADAARTASVSKDAATVAHLAADTGLAVPVVNARNPSENVVDVLRPMSAPGQDRGLVESPKRKARY